MYKSHSFPSQSSCPRKEITDLRPIANQRERYAPKHYLLTLYAGTIHRRFTHQLHSYPVSLFGMQTGYIIGDKSLACRKDSLLSCVNLLHISYQSQHFHFEDLRETATKFSNLSVLRQARLDNLLFEEVILKTKSAADTTLRKQHLLTYEQNLIPWPLRPPKKMRNRIHKAHLKIPLFCPPRYRSSVQS